ncbi:MAG: NAD-dependent epimerase/dehydratase family protein [Bryobacterales bacterium]|nr:NAD-dependent epimerase/dehydratase family protein [Bryobacterales bacterium]
MKTILITGSTGFLGKHLVDELLASEPEARLRLLCRGEGPGITSDRIEIVQGDILDRAAVERAVEGVDEIYHLAGLVERAPSDPWRMFNVHVEGTRNVCEAMRANPAAKAVFASTSGVCAVGREPAELDETAPYAQDVVWDWPYYTSKIYAEKLALWYAEHRKLGIVHINPSLLLGPGDDRRSSTRDVEMFLEGQIKLIPLGGLNLVDVRDVARGAVLALRKGGAGERYLLGGANMTFYEWIRRASKLSGVRAPRMMAPLWVSLWGARVLRKVMPWFGKRFDLDDASIRMSSVYWYCNSQKARAELGFTTRDPDQTLRDTIEYLRASARS